MDDEVVYDSEDATQYTKRQCEDPITPQPPACEVGTRVMIIASDQNYQKLGTVVGFKRNGWYQIGLDEAPFTPVRYRLSSLRLTSCSGFADEAPNASFSVETPMDENEAGFADEHDAYPGTPITPGSSNSSVYSKGTRVQLSYSHKQGTITGYKGGGWYFVYIDEDGEVSMLRRGSFHVRDFLAEEKSSDDATIEICFPKTRIEGCIMAEGSAVDKMDLMTCGHRID